jgi:hypothetical protein
MRNILLRTTFKDDLVLLKPFYAFYKDIWDPEAYVFYIGYSKYDEATILQKIQESLNIQLEYISKTNEMPPRIVNTKIYKSNTLFFVLYATEAQTEASTWDSVMRPFLYMRIDGLPSVNRFKHYLNLDNDDFFYVKDVDECLRTQSILKTHTFEFISQMKFDINNDFEFISSHYYYRLKGAYNRPIHINENNHGWCRHLFLTDPYRVETHQGPSDICSEFNTIRDISFQELDSVCFAFGCLDLDYLLNSKYWLQTDRHTTSKFKHNVNKITHDFNKYYLITDEERKNNLIINCNALKRYFQV